MEQYECFLRGTKDHLLGEIFKIYDGFSFVWGYAQLVAGIEGRNFHEQGNTLKEVTNEGRLMAWFQPKSLVEKDRFGQVCNFSGNSLVCSLYS